jgi:phage terminase large subunit
MQDHYSATSIKSLKASRSRGRREAQTPASSLDLLRPTIRALVARRFGHLEPALCIDPDRPLPEARTHRRLCVIVVEANYADNPWLPDELTEEME